MPSIPRQKMIGFIYLIRIKDMDYFKVGVSERNLNTRLMKLQTASPFVLEVVATREHADPYNVELFIHRELHTYRVRNEWFHVPYEIIREVFDRHSFMASVDQWAGIPTRPTHRKKAVPLRVAKDARSLEELALLKMPDGSYAYPKSIVAQMVGGRRVTVLQKIRKLRGEE